MAFVFPSTKVIVVSFCVVMFLLVASQYLVRKLHSVDGGYSAWSHWSACLKNCGASLQGWYILLFHFPLFKFFILFFDGMTCILYCMYDL